MAHSELKHDRRLATNSDSTAQAASNDSARRLLIDSSGKIRFIGEELSALLKSSPHTGDEVQETHFLFTEPENLYDGSGTALFGSGANTREPLFWRDVRDGAHEIICKDGKLRDLYITRMTTDADDIVIASLFDQSETGEYVLPETGLLSGWATEKLPKETLKKAKTGDVQLSGDDIQNFMDMSNDILLLCSKNGALRKVNSSFLNVFQYKTAQVENLDFLDLVHPEDKGRIRPHLQRMKNGEGISNQVFDFECRCVTQSGDVLWMEWRQKKYGHAFYLVGQDLTRLKTNEMILRRQKSQLSEAQHIGRMGHWTWRMADQSIEWSSELFRIFGVAEDDFTPDMDNVTKLVHRRDVGRTMQIFQRAMIDKKTFEVDFRITRADGETRYVRCQGKCERDTSGDVTAMFGILQDVTERNSYETALKAAKEGAERAYAAKSQFLANMSHELRTPLNAIIGFSEMIERQLLGPIGNDKYLDYISGIRESGEHLLDLITDILDMSKIEAGRYELMIEEVKIAKLIQLAAHMMESRALDDSIKLSVEAEDEMLAIKVDRRAVMQILLNLLSNAVKFSHKGGLVRAECLQREDYIAIKVRDEGIGIPASKLDAITKPFEQVQNQYSRSHEGSGLGLAITKELAELHGGALFVESTLGKGTTVTVRLPYDANLTRKDQAQNGN